MDSAYSAYQRIDVVDDVDGRSLYLDGVPFYRAGDLGAFNGFLADVPAALLRRPGRALVVGSGSFSSAAFLHRRGYDVTVVELDGEVARLGFRDFASVHGLRPGEVRVLIQDGRSVLARVAPASLDLVVLDVPAPYHVRTALLHTRSFYRAVRAALAPGGVVAISLAGDLEGRAGRSIAASAASIFDDILAVDSRAVGLTMLYAAQRLPFTAEDLRAELTARDPTGGRVRDDAAVRRALLGIQPLDRTRLAAVVWMAWEELP